MSEKKVYILGSYHLYKKIIWGRAQLQEAKDKRKIQKAKQMITQIDWNTTVHQIRYLPSLSSPQQLLKQGSKKQYLWLPVRNKSTTRSSFRNFEKQVYNNHVCFRRDIVAGSYLSSYLLTGGHITDITSPISFFFFLNSSKKVQETSYLRLVTLQMIDILQKIASDA